MATYQTASDSTFDEDSTSGSPSTSGLSLVPAYNGSTLTVTAADTDQQTVRFQYEQGGVGSGSWRTIKQWVNVNISGETFANKGYARVRIVAVADAGGASTASITEDVIQVDAINGQDGKPIFTIDSFEKDQLKGTIAQKGIYSRRKHDNLETASFTAGPKHMGKLTGINATGGAVTVTLPSSTGSMDTYEFVLTADPGNNDVIISCDTDAGAFVGPAVIVTDATGAVNFGAGANNDLITLNNTTTGGLHGGDRIRVTDIKTDFWFAEVVAVSSGSETTPFSGS